MSKMQLGYSPMTKKIYIGRQVEKQGYREWVGEKREITNEFLNVCVEYLQQPQILTNKITKKERLFMQFTLTEENVKKTIDLLQKQLKELEQRNLKA